MTKDLHFFPKLLAIILLSHLTSHVNSQNAPSHLKYFGYVAIDCFYDDPLDASATINYVEEVDSFSNLAHMCVFDYTDNIVSRTNFMNDRCLNPILHIQEIFFQYIDTLGPSGANYDLIPNFLERWNTFKMTNESVLNSTNIGCFYIADEPFWNGISLNDMNTVCTLLKSAYPEIPLLMVEAYTTVNVMQVPEAMDWVGFDRYGEFDPQTDPEFQADMTTLKNSLSAPHQKIFLIIDDQWFPEYESFLGWSQDEMADVVQNYYDLAVSDTSIIGLIGYIWPGGLDAPNHHGVRNLTQAVIDKNVEIGQLIKANYSPCDQVGLIDLGENEHFIQVYPNPANEFVEILLPNELNDAEIKIYNSNGLIEKTISISLGKKIEIELNDFTSGLYFVLIQDDSNQYKSKFVIE